MNQMTLWQNKRLESGAEKCVTLDRSRSQATGNETFEPCDDDEEICFKTEQKVKKKLNMKRLPKTEKKVLKKEQNNSVEKPLKEDKSINPEQCSSKKGITPRRGFDFTFSHILFMVPTPTEKPGKLKSIFQSGNFEQTGKVREFYRDRSKYF